VGLTILPPKPGRSEARVTVLGVDPGDALRNARLTGSSGGSRVEVALGEPCGLGCFAGTIDFGRPGEWQLQVEIDSNRGPIAISVTVPLPTPDGASALARTLAAQEALTAAAMVERLSGSVDGPTFVTNYRFEAPDKTELTLKDDTTILAGEQQFKRTGDGPWEKSAFPPPGFSWPAGYYREFWGDMAAARVLGTDAIDGVDAQVIAFVRPDIPAWFRLWVRMSDGVVVRQEMRAEGHLMDQDYKDLNGRISVTLPE
jgi:hypothetical protein